MRIVIVHYVHPATEHVSSIRASFFARELAALGHRVVLLTHTRDQNPADVLPQDLGNALAAHDWSVAFHLAVPSIGDLVTTAARSPKLPGPIRKVAIFSEFVRHGSIWHDWVRGAKPYWRPLASGFQPDIVYALFLTAGNLALAQGLAKTAGVPWVIDHKDNWEESLPKPLHRFLARRYADAVGFTSNADLHAGIAARYFRQPHAVVYSGVAAEMIASERTLPDTAVFRIALIGSVRHVSLLEDYFKHLAAWHAALAPADASAVEVVYAGPSHGLVEPSARSAGLSCRMRVEKYLSLGDLGRLCMSAAVNSYIWTATGFHHKLLELLACRRPVVSYPGEHEESVRLAHAYGGDLRPCTNAAELRSALDGIYRDWRAGSNGRVAGIDVQALTWPAMARKLESFLAERLEAATARRGRER